MRRFDPADWYWTADDGRVFASKRLAVVGKDDAGLAAFAGDGTRPTIWPRDDAGAQTDAALDEVLRLYGMRPDLRAYAAAARYARETAGITVAAVPVATDRDSQDRISGMWAAAQMNPAINVSFKSSAGFVTLDAAQIQSIASAMVAHVQACFAAEAQVDADIAAGKVTTAAQVDAAFAGLTA